MDFAVLINQILVLFLIIVLGYILRKREIITKEIASGFSNILIQITMPVLIIDSILKIELNQEVIKNLAIYTIVALLSYLFLIILSTIVTEKLKTQQDTKEIFKFLLIFPNVGYMGIPVVSSIYPAEAVVYTIINNVIYNMYVWTYGIQIFNNDKKEKFEWRKLINQGTIALTIGFLLLITRLPIGPLRGTISTVGGMTFPISMLVIGSSLTNIKNFDFLKDKYLYYQVFLKLFLIPLLGLLILNPLHLPKMIRDISVIMLAMPCGANSVIFAGKYKSDRLFASKAVFLTTLLSLFTIPLIIFILNLI